MVILKVALVQDLDNNERILTAPKQRISIYCIAESLDRKALEERLESRYEAGRPSHEYTPCCPRN